MKKFLIVLAVFLIAGCGDELPAGMKGLKRGMSRDEAIAIAGQPENITKLAHSEILRYTDEKNKTPFLIVIKDGKVFEFGGASDFGD